MQLDGWDCYGEQCASHSQLFENEREQNMKTNMLLSRTLVMAVCVFAFLATSVARGDSGLPWPGIAMTHEESSQSINTALTYTYLNIHARLPKEVRDIPKHPDDSGYQGTGYGDGQAPIDRENYNANHGLEFSVMYAKKYGTIKDGSTRYNVAAGLKWLIFPYLIADREERNYRNAPGTDQRGYGAALTYVELIQGGIVPSTGESFIDFLLNWTPEVKFEVAPFSGDFKNVWLGVSLSYCTLAAQTGWDRYDSLEVRENCVLAYEIPTRLYLSFLDDKDEGGFTVGAQFQPAIVTSLGKGNVEMPFVVPFAALSWRF